MAVQRRISNPAPDSYAFVIGPSIKWTSSNQVEFPKIPIEKLGAMSASLGLNLTRRWDDSYQGQSERIWSVAPIATFVWQPPIKWLKSAPEVDFQVAYSSQSSTTPSDTKHQWGIGPTLKFGWSF
jgi:hypothetical protein